MPEVSTGWQILILGTSWLLYCVLHSVLASLRVKHWVASSQPRWMPAYRLIFNAQAVLLLIPILALTLAFRGEPLWSWNGPWQWLSLGLSGLAVAGFIWSLGHYDGLEFIGLRQWRDRIHSVEDQERLHISPLHRFVRHPWYFLGLLLVWTRDMDPAFLTSALAINLYFWWGSRLEERKLLAYHGEAYRRYRSKVPGLFPLPWRYLSAEEARRLQTMD